MSMTMSEQKGQQPARFGGVQARSNSKINEPRIAIRKLDFFYADNRALKQINLDLPERPRN